MRLILALCAILVCAPAMAEKSAADKWEQALQEKKRNGTLPGPKPGQKCLWSEKLKACLWYTPGKWDSWADVALPFNEQTGVSGWGMYGRGFQRYPF